MAKIFRDFEIISTSVQKISAGALKKTVDLEFVVGFLGGRELAGNPRSTDSASRGHRKNTT